MLALPPGENPTQEWGKALRAREGGALVTLFGGGFAVFIAEAFAHGGGLALQEGSEKVGDGGQTAGARHDDSKAPESQGGGLGLGEVRQVVGHSGNPFLQLWVCHRETSSEGSWRYKYHNQMVLASEAFQKTYTCEGHHLCPKEETPRRRAVGW
ncbi:MAG: hypothetical protein N2559_11340 [Anaerolineae bacterium]|nr:hypothetical protein [Anaerolineae bacterium]